MANRQFTFPLLLRSPGYHTGRNFILVETAAELSTAAAGLPGDDLLVIEYLDARGRDGNARKYRVMMIGGRIYPLHLAISQQMEGALFHFRYGRAAGPSAGGSEIPRRYAGSPRQ